MRIKYLCVLKDEVVELPVSRIEDGIVTKKELANKTVLKVEMIYETENRKPAYLKRIIFDRATFDSHGVYNFFNESSENEFKTKLEYIFSDLYNSNDRSSLPIPVAPTIPTDEEIEIFKHYVNRKYPLLLKNSPLAFENAIYKSKAKHKEEMIAFKESHKSNSNSSTLKSKIK